MTSTTDEALASSVVVLLPVVRGKNGETREPKPAGPIPRMHVFSSAEERSA
jgi:hypothetical protein